METSLRQINFKMNNDGSILTIFVLSRQNTNLFFVQTWQGFEYIPANEFEKEYNDNFLDFIESHYGCSFMYQIQTKDKEVLSRWIKIFELLTKQVWDKLNIK